MQQPQITEKPEFTVVGLRRAFIHALAPEANNLQVLGSLWGEFLAEADRIPNRIGDAMFGIIYGEPEDKRAHPHELQYIAAVPVSSASDVPVGMVPWTVPATTFAVFTHKGRIENIGTTVHEIYRVWLPQSPYQHSEIADIERYDHRFRPDRDDSEMDYWVSVSLKSSPKVNAT